MGQEGPLRGFLTKKDKRTVSTWVNLDDIDPIDFWPILKGKHAIERKIAVSMFFGLIDTNKKFPDCNGTMKLQVNAFRKYIDKLHWKCCKDGILKSSNTISTHLKKKIKRILQKRTIHQN